MYIITTLRKLSGEYEKAIRWFKKCNLKDIKNMSSIEKIIFFNLWIVSYYVIRYTQEIELDKYNYSINGFFCLINDIEKIINKNPHFIYNSTYINYNNYNFGEKDYEFCVELLNMQYFNQEYLDLVNKEFTNQSYYNKMHNLKNCISNKIKKYIELKKILN